ncbi:hypothetical protein VZT92_024063 [Zoarces viviparus]|uniref:Uncharacterized protein n=1 Tax=Zoarces viviparus TaxID=48416 RepID=A0AAW1E0U3_ZOAVI
MMTDLDCSAADGGGSLSLVGFSPPAPLTPPRSVKLGALDRVGGTEAFCFHSSFPQASRSLPSAFLSTSRCLSSYCWR